MIFNIIFNIIFIRVFEKTEAIPWVFEKTVRFL